MSECKCFTQELQVMIWKKKEHWYEGWAWAPLFKGSETIVVHGDSLEELVNKKNEVKEAFQKRYPGLDIEVWT